MPCACALGMAGVNGQKMQSIGPGTGQPAQGIPPVPGWINNFFKLLYIGVHYLLKICLSFKLAILIIYLKKTYHSGEVIFCK